jgi:hypothetical protein
MYSPPPPPDASLCCTLTEMGIGRGTGLTSATISDGGVFEFTGTARPLLLDLMCLTNQPGVLNTRASWSRAVQ